MWKVVQLYAQDPSLCKEESFGGVGSLFIWRDEIVAKYVALLHFLVGDSRTRLLCDPRLICIYGMTESTCFMA